uniref:multidrug resistance-associated protein 4-like n=1 Tax=Styela clava TaxID=7725 RepID=UPI001939E4CF|nr:multidrug resistance-associated protein 4-like [Styela clava]
MLSIYSIAYRFVFQTLRLSQKSLNNTTTGEIVNLGATDVLRFDRLPSFLHYLWVGPLQCLIVGIILWQEIGIAVLSGMGVLILIMFLQTFSGRAFGKIRSMTAVLTDERIRLMNEVINGMRIIKMYAWEKPFAKLVSNTRRKEVEKILLSSSLKACNFCFYACQDKILTFVTLLTYVALGGTITASKGFMVLSISSALRISVGFAFPRGLTLLFESLTSFARIEKYLLMDEFSNIRNNLKSNSNQEIHVELENFTGKWELNNDAEERSDITLDCVNVRVDAGKLVAVIGPVGAGKVTKQKIIAPSLRNEYKTCENKKVSLSSLLNAILGELPAAEGKAIDLDLLIEGDMTLIGERGVTLSGGQKARVSLARAAYKRNAVICLLDDPLSAVDISVASHIFEHCICGIMKKKARILVTHQLQLLKSVDEILIFKEGRVYGRGTYAELQDSGVDFAALLRKKEDDNESVFCEKRQTVRGSPLSLRDNSNDSTQTSIVPDLSIEDTEIEGHTAKIIAEEMREQGSIGGKVYLEYFRVAANAFLLVLFFIIVIASHVLYIMNDWWLSKWTTSYKDYLSNLSSNNPDFSSGSGQNEPSEVFNSTTSFTSVNNKNTFDSSYYIKIYAVLSSMVLLIVLLRANLHFYICVTSGIHMHKKMFEAILRAPIRFFDTNPAGRILNRFSKDMGQIDEFLPIAFIDFLWILGVIVSVVILTSAVNYFVIIVIIPLVIYFLWLRIYYLRTSRDIKRLEGTCRSPVFSLLSSTLQGLLTIRAFGVQQQFEDKFHEYQDLHSASWFLFLVGTRWFGLRLDLITATFISAVTFFSVICASLLNLNAGEIGLVLTYTASLISIFQWGVRQSAEVENLMTSVERVQQYYRLPPEAALENPAKKPPNSWPECGAIKFENVSFSYYDGGPNVLRSIDFVIQPKEKIGIVGRTGAGKSSLISALFRLSELTSGEIFIDGIPISSLGLQDLRKALSIIPQDPMLFTGTVRRNIDPFNNYLDEDLWDALEQVQLKELVESFPLKLNTELAESGSNLSVGQRQLVCLARAVLRKSKILVIDEATANVDIRTDRLIQKTIRRKFKQCTVITIAHRINTIIDSDKILVLEEGQVKEFDKPNVLLHKRDGLFASIVKSAGLSAAEPNCE